MNLDDLKSDWQNSDGGAIDEQRLQMMTKIDQHPTLKKLRIKLILEAIFLTMLLFVYFDGFDGDKKSFLVNALFISSILLYITNNVLGYFFTKNPIRADNILQSVQKQVQILRRLSVFSLLSAVIYGAMLIVFFATSIEFTFAKYVMLGALILSFVIMFYLSYKKWRNKINHFSSLLTKYITDIA